MWPFPPGFFHLDNVSGLIRVYQYFILFMVG